MTKSASTTIDDDQILSGDVLRKKLESLLPSSKKKVIFISACVTQSGIDWFCKYTPKEIPRHIICRLLPYDVISGSSHLSALKTALDQGVKISCLHSLHAKIYTIDNEFIYSGSANLTSNGLKIYGTGNLEASQRVVASQANLEFIENICTSSTELNEEILQKMQACIDLKEKETFLDEWPDGVLKENEGMWVRDFFWSQPYTTVESTETIHDLEILCVSDFNVEESLLKENLLASRCTKWLFEVLRNSDNHELFFGNLSKILHNDIKDDPAPYRKNIKLLLQNLLAYCEKYLKSEIEITRPNHSQK